MSACHLMRSYVKLVVGILLMTGGGVGLLHAVRAAQSAWGYYRAHYAAGAASPDEVLRLCERAYRTYPENHWLCLWAADAAFQDRDSGSKQHWQRRLDETELWTGRGLLRNPYDARLRELKARLLVRRSPAEAVAYWREYLDWSFWSPEHHLVMLQLCLAADDFAGAMESLRWLKGTSKEAEGRGLVRQAWAWEMKESRKAEK